MSTMSSRRTEAPAPQTSVASHRARAFAAVVVLAAGLLLVGVPIAAQDGALDTGADTAADIAELLPETIAGVETDVSVVRGREHLEGLDPTDDVDAEQIASLEAFASELGGELDDLTTISAIAVDGEALSFVAGVQLAGADPEEMLRYYIESLIADMNSPYQELGEIGGKTATLIVDETYEDDLPLYVYGDGPRVWLIVAELAIVEELLAALP